MLFSGRDTDDIDCIPSNEMILAGTMRDPPALPLLSCRAGFFCSRVVDAVHAAASGSNL